MQIQYHKYIKTFFLALALVVFGTMHVDPVASGETAPQNNVHSAAVPGQLAPRLQNLGDYKFPVTTSSPRAQLFINQGIMLAYGFNHAEAARSFREASRLDPKCAMA